MKKKSIIFTVIIAILTVTFAAVLSVGVFAATSDTAEPASESTTTVETVEQNTDDSASAKAIAAAIVVGLVGAAGAIGMAIAIAKCAESMARQPEIASKINSVMMLGLVFIETAIIYALIIAILVIFVL